MYYLFLLIIIWLINLETNPGLGGIWYRVNSLGNNTIQIKNIINIIYHSFTDPLFWNIHMIDINLILFLIFGIIIYYFTHFISKYIFK
jgi:hypothetical protein